MIKGLHQNDCPFAIYILTKIIKKSIELNDPESRIFLLYTTEVTR